MLVNGLKWPSNGIVAKRILFVIAIAYFPRSLWPWYYSETI
jgi:hypothetical protein